MNVLSTFVGVFDTTIPDTVSTKCGWCAHHVQMKRVGSTVELRRLPQPGLDEIVRVSAPFVCTNYECHRLSIVLFTVMVSGATFDQYPSLVGAIPAGREQPMDGLPPEIEVDRLEAWACHYALNWKAAVIMGRAAIQRAVRRLNAAGGDLKAELKSLLTNGTITNAVHELGEEVRITGNEAAHPDEFDDEVTADESKASLEFMDAFLEHAVAMPARLKARREAREVRENGGDDAET